MQITNTSQLEEYLNSHSIPFTSIQTLSAGAANYAWRITDASDNRSIIKHAAPYLRIDPSIALPVERLDFEAQAISALASIQPAESLVKVPRLLHYDPQAHLIQIADAGSRNLAEAFSSFAPLNTPSLGARIGTWLAHLHSTPTHLHVGDNQLARHASQHSARSLIPALRQLGLDASVGERTFALLFEAGAEDDASCQCHGDFLPSNIVVADDDAPEAAPRHTVVDWEWTRRGNGAFDVALFAGEAWLLEHFRSRGGVERGGMLDPFLAAYLAARDLSVEDRLMVAARFGVQITYWPWAGRWGEEGRDECVVLGYELLRRVVERDLDWLRRSMLRTLFERVMVSSE